MQANLMGGTCRPSVYEDGVPLPADLVTNGELDFLIPATEIEAVEVYRGPSETPAQYAMNRCGVILIWRRR